MYPLLFHSNTSATHLFGLLAIRSFDKYQNDIKFLTVRVGSLKDSYVGNSEKIFNAIFDYAFAHTPCVIFFDEAEDLLYRPPVNRDGGGAVQRDLVNVYLTRIGGIDSNPDAMPLLIAATNSDPNALSGAAVSRYKAKFFVDFPGFFK